MTEERPDWRWSLHPHWDWNPWVYQSMLNRGLPRMYQGAFEAAILMLLSPWADARSPDRPGILALDDCPEEVGGHITIPGSAAYLPTWVRSPPLVVGRR